MTTLEEQELLHPDKFAEALQDLLIEEGPRSRGVQKLRRLATRERNFELQRILESKLAAYRRHHRESRTPTVWNLPERAVDWIWDDARFVPPRDVVMTLVYVIIALTFVEAVKRYGLPEIQPAEVPGPGAAVLSYEFDSSEAERPLAKVEEWLVNELSVAARSKQVENVLASRIDSALDEMLSSEEFREKLRNKLLASSEVTTTEGLSSLDKSLNENLENTETVETR